MSHPLPTILLRAECRAAPKPGRTARRGLQGRPSYPSDEMLQ